MKKEKKDLPIWQVGLAVVAALALVGLVFARGGGGEASKDEIATMRHAQSNQPLSIPNLPGNTGATNLAR